MMPGQPQSETRQTKAQLEARICVTMGGRIAEEIFCGDIATGAKSDIEQATELAREHVSIYGMSAGNVFMNTADDSWLSQSTKSKRDDLIFELIEGCYAKTKALLVAHKAKVELLQAALLERETLLEEEIKSILS
eukprot:gnl/TRDRNA2_/TRDRNA2_159419_c3_seq3.p1 gnl/TRDRNA2_/TRDRNA2_159419_c3~~gnl/TRDRNA2_/TRDRNA2_159419_c3_seq3.p1  ORF type:complete len:135 (-),score=22.91 gnl/TRDRNA2_/TRDRNA2_159419_c3_seq3:77-481(-)